MSQVDMMKLREELAARDIEWSGDWDNNGMTTSWESLDGQHFQCFQRGWNGNLAIIIRDVTPEQAIAATLGEACEDCYLICDGKKLPVELDCGFTGLLPMPVAITVSGFRYSLEVPE